MRVCIVPALPRGCERGLRSEAQWFHGCGSGTGRSIGSGTGAGISVGGFGSRAGSASGPPAAGGIVAGASGLVFPSLFEGYGMPVVEAMAARTPVLASSDPSIDEAAGGAAVRFDPGDAPRLAEALAKVLRSDSERSRLILAGMAFAETRHWAATGVAFAAALEQTLAV